MESESALHGDGADGAEVSPLAENQAGENGEEHSENNVSSQDEGTAADDSGITVL